MATTIVKATKSSVPGQYLGYGLQDVRLCHHLLKAPSGSSVSLEYIEDTAVHLAGQPLLLEQSKSALANNPLSDSAFDLWKSFANWASLCVEGTIDPASTIFRYYACPKKDGKLAEQMHAARTEAEVDGLLAVIAKKVTSANQLKGCNPKISEFLSAGTVICRQIILNFELLCEDDPLEAIREVLRFAVFEDSVDDFCAYAIGAAKNWIADLIAAGQTPVIDAAAFRKQVQSFVRKHGILGLLVPTTTSPSAADVQKIVSAAPLFVQQLLRIEVSKDQLVRAVGNYLQSSADRTMWAADGRIVEASLEEFDSDLESRFGFIRDEVEEIHAHLAETARGRAIYRECMKLQAVLEGRDVPLYFVPGSFNLLADTLRVGWHPHYAEFFGS
jgi:hypothetical protein